MKGDPAMTIRIGDKVPNFKAQTTEGAIDFYNWMGKSWVLLISHPADFTPVCTTELAHVARMKSEFESRGVKVLGLSVNTLQDHREWVEDIERTLGVKLNFPVIADPKRRVADMFDMIQGNGNMATTGRSALIIDSDKKVRLIIIYPESTGRNFDEILRTVDSLKLTSEYGLATPANWVPGEEAIILPDITDDEAKMRYPQGWTEHNRYLRMVADPVN